MSETKPRNERYADTVARMVRERDEARAVLVEAVAALLVLAREDFGLLDRMTPECRIAAEDRARELRSTMTAGKR